MLTPGQQLSLAIEKAAVGGPMIARAEGQVVLVSGAIPGERVIVRIDRVERRLALATVVDVEEASPDRRTGLDDPLCGGCVYSHIAYPRQLALKADVLRDAFLRIGKIPNLPPLSVADSPERAYRMRARLHATGGRIGFYREGSHVLCDARPTGQLSSGSLDAVSAVVEALGSTGARATSIELTENVPNDQRALSIGVEGTLALTASTLAEMTSAHGLTGCVVHDERRRRLVAGEPSVSDAVATLTGDPAIAGQLQRHSESFFQGNRFLLPALVRAVAEAVLDRGPILDLYAGVGLFSVTLGASGRQPITAVEGDRTSGADLQRNAAQYGDGITVVFDSVEAYLAGRPAPAATVVVDPPRTGISAEALAGISRLAAPRIVYVSCDPATMARDARRLLDGGYRLESLQAFDLFPNTPHVESLGVFAR